MAREHWNLLPVGAQVEIVRRNNTLLMGTVVGFDETGEFENDPLFCIQETAGTLHYIQDRDIADVRGHNVGRSAI